MEILQHTIKKIDTSSFNRFQLGILNILILIFEKLKFNEISDKSTIDEMPYLDIIIRLNNNDFVLNLSIRKNLFIINSNYFDINVYPETDLDKIKILLEEIFDGKYFLHLSYGRNGKLIFKELIFEKNRINEFNQKHKMTMFNKKVKEKENIKGYKLTG
jgi:hypothetical protein